MARTPLFRRAAVLASLLLVVVAAPAAAQSTDPGLTVDQRFAPPDGVARDDLNGDGTDIPAGVAAFGGRVYTVGETRDTASNSNIGIVARLTNGLPDTGFDGDGRLSLAVAAGIGKDAPTDIAALPDGRLRVLASYDADPAEASNISTVVIGLLPDGSLDPAFGGGDGLATFKASAGIAADAPTRMAIDGDGRIAVTGGVTDAANKEDSFVALLDAAGTPIPTFGTGGVVRLPRADGGLNDRGVDVAFRPGGGLLAYLRVETNPADSANDYVAVLRAFDDTGNLDPRFNGTGDLVLPVGAPDTVAGGLLVLDGRIVVSGSTKVGLDTDAFVARFNPDGSDFQARTFDMRGATIEDSELVTSAVSDLVAVPGPPQTLVGTGSINYSSRPYWAAVAFQNVGAPLDQWRSGDLVVPTAEYGALVGATPLADGSLAVAGSLVDTSSNFDTSFGTSRLLVDVKKVCNLALTVSKPLELAFPAGTTTPVTMQVTNAGSRPCGGTLSVSARFALGGEAVTVPTLDPGATWTSTAMTVRDTAARRSDDVATFSVAAPRDSDPSNNTDPVRVRFDYCDLALRAVDRAPLLPTEGRARLAFSVKNVGTRDCRSVAAGVTGAKPSSGSRFSLRRGRSADVVLRVAAPRKSKPGRRRALSFTATATDQANPDNDVAEVTARLVRPGSTSIRRTGARRITGTATSGSAGAKAPAAARRAVALRRVQVAIQRPGARCATVTGAAGRLRVASGKRCGAPVWITTSGARRWSLALRRGLPPGRWVVRSRAVARDGDVLEAASDRRNTTTLRVR